MVYYKLFQNEQEKQAFTDNYEYLSFVVENQKVNIHKYDYSQDYLTFVAKSSGTFKFNGSSSGYTANTIQYSTNDGETWSEASSSITVNVNSNDKVLWKSSNLTPFQSKGIGTFGASTAELDIQGNIMSLLYGDNFVGQVDLSGKDYAFCYLFKKTKCVKILNLVLPSTTLVNSCYRGMFQDCTSLTTTIELPATTLVQNCYNAMFLGCTSLTTTPELPATTLAYNCYGFMFADCTSLTQAPQLPATTLANSCYSSMFNGCTSLTKAPELPATTLANSCYSSMLANCTSLTTAPELQATTLTESCYQYMFQGCTSLTTAPELIATTLANYCYSYMFSGCTNLTQAPQLPATTLNSNCYQYMFQGCTSLTTAPELPATRLAVYCYHYMFQNCSNLNYIKAMFTDTPTIGANNWVDGVSSSGTFVKNSAATWDVRGVNGIPEGWTVETTSS